MLGRLLKRITRRNDSLEWADQPEWTAEDKRALMSFMISGTGKKLALILRNQVIMISMEAVSKKESLPWECGYASGFKGAVALLDQASGANQPTEPEGTEGSPSDLEHLSP